MVQDHWLHPCRLAIVPALPFEFAPFRRLAGRRQQRRARQHRRVGVADLEQAIA
jgi:hypothetical protein